MSQSISIQVIKDTMPVATYQVYQGERVTITNESKAHYQLIDNQSHLAPEHITMQREGLDLLISFPNEDDQPLDVLIQNYYREDATDNEIMGEKADGNLYRYDPDLDTAYAVGALEDNASGTYTLGNDEIVEAIFEFNPHYLLGLVPVLGIASAAIHHHNEHKRDDEVPDVGKPQISVDETGATVTVGVNSDALSVQYQDSNGTLQIIETTLSNGQWQSQTTLPDGVSLDSNTGTLFVSLSAAMNGSLMSATSSASYDRASVSDPALLLDYRELDALLTLAESVVATSSASAMDADSFSYSSAMGESSSLLATESDTTIIY